MHLFSGLDPCRDGCGVAMDRARHVFLLVASKVRLQQLESQSTMRRLDHSLTEMATRTVKHVRLLRVRSQTRRAGLYLRTADASLHDQP
jgi:hypothetical protein